MIKFVFVPPYSFAINNEENECVFCKCNKEDIFDEKFAKELLLARLEGDKDYEKWLIDQEYPKFKFGDKVKVSKATFDKTLKQEDMTVKRAFQLIDYKDVMGIVVKVEDKVLNIIYEDGSLIRASKNIVKKVGSK